MELLDNFAAQLDAYVSNILQKASSVDRASAVLIVAIMLGLAIIPRRLDVFVTVFILSITAYLTFEVPDHAHDILAASALFGSVAILFLGFKWRRGDKRARQQLASVQELRLIVQQLQQSDERRNLQSLRPPAPRAGDFDFPMAKSPSDPV